MPSQDQILSENQKRFKNYSVSQTSIEKRRETSDYFYKLIEIKLGLLKKYAPYGRILDIGCGCGDYLFLIKDLINESGVGIDFSASAVERAQKTADEKKIKHLQFFCRDFQQSQLPDGHFDCVYSFSTLYAIPDMASAVKEISLKLKPKAIAILDLGNKMSLNTIVSGAQVDAPLPCYVSIGEIKKCLKDNGLDVMEWRAFQILPYWGKDPWWLRPVLLSFWKRISAVEFNGKMLDEWVASSFLFKPFAFRHIVVCRKNG